MCENSLVRPRRTMPQLPTRPNADSNKAREVQRLAYRLGAEARFHFGQTNQWNEAGALAQHNKAMDTIENLCAEYGLADAEKQKAMDAVIFGFTKATFPPNALHIVFERIKQIEDAGLEMKTPRMLRRASPAANTRLWQAALQLGYNGAECLEFQFGCNAVADAYKDTFNEMVYPTTVRSFLTNAELMCLLECTHKGTRGPNGKAGVYRLLGNPKQMGLVEFGYNLRHQWEMIASIYFCMDSL